MSKLAVIHYECVFIPVNNRLIQISCQTDDIKPGGPGFVLPVLMQVSLGSPDDALLFTVSDTLCCCAKVARFAVADLDKTDRIFIHGDDIDFTQRTAEIVINYVVLLLTQMCACELFAMFSE